LCLNSWLLYQWFFWGKISLSGNKQESKKENNRCGQAERLLILKKNAHCWGKKERKKEKENNRCGQRLLIFEKKCSLLPHNQS
jgi:hypothetical protein